MLRERVELLTTAQVARRLSQSEESIRRKARDGTLPVIRLGDGPRAQLRFDLHELENWLARDSVHEGGMVNALPGPIRIPANELARVLGSSPAPGNDSAERRAPDSRQVEAQAHSGEAA